MTPNYPIPKGPKENPFIPFELPIQPHPPKTPGEEQSISARRNRVLQILLPPETKPEVAASDRPLRGALLEKLKEQRDYLSSAGQSIAGILPHWQFKPLDPQAKFSLREKDRYLEVTLILPVDQDSDSANGRIFFQERYVLDPYSFELKGVERKWQVAPEVPKEIASDLQNSVRNLNREAGPTLEEAAPFIGTFLPTLLKPEPKFEPWKKDLSFQLKSPWTSPFWTKRKELKAEAKSRILQGWWILEQLVEEKTEKDIDGKGWLHSLFEIDNAPAADRVALRSLRRKAIAAVTLNSSSSPFQMLRHLDLDPKERALVGRILNDPLCQKVEAIASNPNSEERAREFLHLARELAIDQELPKTAGQIARIFQESPASREEANRWISLVEGKGSFGTKAEYLLPRFGRDLLSPTILFPMILAPFAGAAAESCALNLLQEGVKLWGRFPKYFMHVSAFPGLAAEGFAFTTFHNIFKSAVHNPDRVWENWAGETGRTILSFGLMRLAHAGSGWVSRQMADPRFSAWATGGETGWRHLSSPTGRIYPYPYFGGDLNWKGRGLSETLHHVAGLGAFFAANQLSPNWGDKNPQGTMGDFFDSLLLYLNTLIGFNLANKLTYGQLQTELAEVRIRTLLSPNAGANITGGGNGVEYNPTTMQILEIPHPLNQPAQPILMPPQPFIPRPEQIGLRPILPPPRAGVVDPAVDPLNQRIQELERAISDLQMRGYELEGKLVRTQGESIQLKTELERVEGLRKEEAENNRLVLGKKDAQIEELKAQVAREVGRAAELQKRLRDGGRK